MDVVILSVVAGAAVLGALWGLVRMVTVLVAIAGAFFVGRLAGPPLAALLFSPAPGSAQNVLASVLAGALAGAALFASGTGIRKLLEGLRLALLDRLLGALGTAGATLFLASLLLALMASGGWKPEGSITPKLTQVGEGFLSAYKAFAKSRSPQTTPNKPTKSGQQPADS